MNRAGDVFLVALSARDAVWLGFEADDGRAFAVVPSVDGRPADVLVVPDQPWFDVTDGGRQLVAPHAGPDSPGLVTERIELAVREVPAGAAAPPPDGPVPLASPSGADGHPWRRRAVEPRWMEAPPTVVTLTLVDPATFTAATGTPLPDDLFADTAPPPPPRLFP